MFLRLTWADNARQELLLPCFRSDLQTAQWLIGELKKIWDSGRTVEALLEDSWTCTVMDRLIRLFPLVGTSERLSLADLRTEPELIEKLFFEERLLSDLLEQDIQRFTSGIDIDSDAPGLAPIDPEASLLASLIGLDGTVAGAIAIQERYSAGFCFALHYERLRQLNPEVFKEKEARKIGDKYTEENMDQIRAREQAFLNKVRRPQRNG